MILRQEVYLSNETRIYENKNHAKTSEASHTTISREKYRYYSRNNTFKYQYTASHKSRSSEQVLSILPWRTNSLDSTCVSTLIPGIRPPLTYLKMRTQYHPFYSWPCKQTRGSNERTNMQYKFRIAFGQIEEWNAKE